MDGSKNHILAIETSLKALEKAFDRSDERQEKTMIHLLKVQGEILRKISEHDLNRVYMENDIQQGKADIKKHDGRISKMEGHFGKFFWIMGGIGTALATLPQLIASFLEIAGK